MIFSLPQIILLLSNYKYYILFPIAVLEGPIITIVGGFLASMGHLNVYLVFLIVVLGDLVGDILYYAIGRWGGIRLVNKFGHYFGADKEKIIALEKYFKRHSWKILFFGKTQPIGSAILLAAGLAKVPYGEFLLYNLLGTVPKSIILLAIGFFFGQGYLSAISRYADYTAFGFIALAIVFIIIYWAIRKYLKNKNRLNA